MDLTNLTIGQKLYSAINGEVTFMGYIDDPEGKPCLICTAKNNRFFYYFIDGKYDIEGQIILFISMPSRIAGVEITDTNEDKITGVKEDKFSKEDIKDIIQTYNEVIDCPTAQFNSIDEIVEEIWQRLQ